MGRFLEILSMKTDSRKSRKCEQIESVIEKTPKQRKVWDQMASPVNSTKRLKKNEHQSFSNLPEK